MPRVFSLFDALSIPLHNCESVAETQIMLCKRGKILYQVPNFLVSFLKKNLKKDAGMVLIKIILDA
jgi:hypothetical protein